MDVSEPWPAIVRHAAARVAQRVGLEPNWLNGGVKGFGHEMHGYEARRGTLCAIPDLLPTRD